MTGSNLYILVSTYILYISMVSYAFTYSLLYSMDKSMKECR